MKIIKSCFMLFVVLTISACQQHSKTYADLMSHPEELKKAVNKCDANQAPQAYCDMVQHAQTDFSNLYNQWREGPEDFGKIIINIETTNADSASLTDKIFSEPLTHKQLVAAYLAVVGLTPIE